MKEQKPACVAHGDKYRNQYGYCEWCCQLGRFAPGYRKPPQPAAFARTYDPSTSHAAADSMPDDRLDGLHKQIMDCCRQYPEGLTILEVQALTGIDMQTVSPRFAYLVRHGYLVRDGKKINAATQRPAFIHKVAA